MNTCLNAEYVALDYLSRADVPEMNFNVVSEFDGILSPSVSKEIASISPKVNKLRAVAIQLPEPQFLEALDAYETAHMADVVRRDLGCAACKFTETCSTGQMLDAYSTNLPMLAEQVDNMDTVFGLKLLRQEDKSLFTDSFIEQFNINQQTDISIKARPLTGEFKDEVVSCVNGLKSADFATGPLSIDFKERDLLSHILVRSDKDGRKLYLLNITNIDGNNHDAGITQANAGEWMAKNFDSLLFVLNHRRANISTLADYGQSTIKVGNGSRACRKLKFKDGGSLRRLVAYSMEMQAEPDSRLVIYSTISQPNNVEHEQVDRQLS